MDSDQRAMRHMKLPERGILRVTGVHDGHSHSRISGVITAPGIAPTRVEHKVDERGRVAIGQELPVLVDCADPSRFAILWDEAGSATFAPSSFQYGPEVDVSSTVVSIGPDGQPYSAALPPDMAARVEAALDQAFSQRGRAMPPGVAARVEQALDRALGQAGLQGQGISEAITQALGRASGQGYGATGGPYGQGGAQAFDPAAGPSYGQGGAQPYGQGGGAQSYGQGGAQPYGQGDGAQPYGQGGAQPYGQGGAQPYGQGGAQPFDPAAGPSYGQGGQWGAQPYGQEATGFPQVSWTDQGGSGAARRAGSTPPSRRNTPRAEASRPARSCSPPRTSRRRPGFAAPGAAVDLTLEVRRADGSVYTAHTTLSMPTPEARAAVATPGARLSVLIDPNDPAWVEIDPYGRI